MIELKEIGFKDIIYEVSITYNIIDIAKFNFYKHEPRQ